MEQVPNHSIIEALAYLDIPISDELKKGLESKSLDGAEQSGGDSAPNDLNKKKSELQGIIQKAKEDLKALEKEDGELKKVEDPEKVGDEEEAKKKQPLFDKEKIEKSYSPSPLDMALGSGLTKVVELVKSQQGQIEALTGKIEEFLQAPQERRSAANVDFLKKSIGVDKLESDGEGAPAANLNQMSILEKSRVSNALMNIYSEGGCKDQNLASAIMTYESAGVLERSTIDLMKSKGITILA